MKHTIEETRREFCPFREPYLQYAIEVLNEADVEETLYDLCRKFGTALGIKLEDIDPVYAVYDHIFQMVRYEIDVELGVDILNDFRDTIEIFNNYLATSYGYNEMAKNNIQKLLEDNDSVEWSNTALWFFTQIEVDPFVGGDINE